MEVGRIQLLGDSVDRYQHRFQFKFHGRLRIDTQFEPYVDAGME